MAGGAGAVRAGRAFVELFTNNNALYRGLDDAAKRLKSWGSTAARIGAGIGGAGAAAGAPLLGLFKAAADRGATLDRLTKQLGAPAEAVSGLAFAFERAGVGLDEFGGVMTALGDKISGAADGADETFQRLKINGRALINLPWAERLDLIADGLAGIKNPADQARFAQELFGDAGLKMFDVLRKGSAGLREQAAAGKAMGAVWSGPEVKQATAVTRAITDAQLALKYAAFQVGRELLAEAGGVEAVKAGFVGGVQAVRQWVQENRGYVVVGAKVAAGLVAGGAAAVALGFGLMKLGALLGGAVVGLKAVFAVLLALTSPVGLVTAAVVGLGVAWATQSAAGRQALGEFEAGFRQAAETAEEAWGAIGTALSRGDLEGAVKVAVAGVEVEWRRLIRNLTAGWNAFKVDFKDSLAEITTDFAAAMVGINAKIPKWVKAVNPALAVAEHALGLNGLDPKQVGRNLAEDHANRQRANHDARQQDLDDAERRLKEAKERFRGAVGEEQEKAQAEAVRRGFRDMFRGKDRAHDEEEARAKLADKMAAMPRLFDAVKGTFALSSGTQQLGYADTAGKRALDAVPGIAKNAAELPAIRKQIEKVADNLVVQ